MRTIWKYRVRASDTFTHKIPLGARFLSVQTQKGDPQMWFTVETNNQLEERRFFVAGTGQEIPQDLFIVSDYLGTFQLSDGALVFHLFEVLSSAGALLKTLGW